MGSEKENQLGYQDEVGLRASFWQEGLENVVIGFSKLMDPTHTIIGSLIYKQRSVRHGNRGVKERTNLLWPCAYTSQAHADPCRSLPHPMVVVFPGAMGTLLAVRVDHLVSCRHPLQSTSSATEQKCRMTYHHPTP